MRRRFLGVPRAAALFAATAGMLVGGLAFSPREGWSADTKIIPGSICRYQSGNKIHRYLGGVTGSWSSSEVVCPLVRENTSNTPLEVWAYVKDPVVCTVYSCNTLGGNWRGGGCYTDTSWGSYGGWFQMILEVSTRYANGTDVMICSLPGVTGQISRIISVEN